MRTEAFINHATRLRAMSKATKIVLGTVGVSAVLSVGIVLVLAFG